MTDSLIPLPEATDTLLTEREGIGYVSFMAPQMGLIWREIPNSDLGIDGYLEVIVDGVPIGLIAAQVKSGLSYIEHPTNDNFTFRAEKKHVKYWLGYRLPVIIIVYDPQNKTAYWRYIQDYFQAQDQSPDRTDKVPIVIHKSFLFDKMAKERLVEIAALPDAKAYAMLTLHAARYNRTFELLTRAEMLELYVKREWLGSWLPLSEDKEQILLHSTLAKRGPGWFWFRKESQRDCVPYLRTALKHPDITLRREAAFALASAVGREAINDLSLLLDNDSVFDAVSALASIPDLTSDDKKQIVADCRAQREKRRYWSRSTLVHFLSLIAKIDSAAVQEQFREVFNDPYIDWEDVIKLADETRGVRQSVAKESDLLGDEKDLGHLLELYCAPFFGHGNAVSY